MRTYAEWVENNEGMTLAEAVVKGAVDAKTVPEGIGRPTDEELGRVAGLIVGLGHPDASDDEMQSAMVAAEDRLGLEPVSPRFERGFLEGFAVATQQ